MNHLNMDASQAISNWYRKETYLKSYSYFIQPVPNMKMWPESRNPIVEPSEARKMPDRLKVNRRKEIGEVRKAGKLSKFGIKMTCSLCRGANHNKRGCPKKFMPKPTPECVAASQQSSAESKRGRGQYERGSTSSAGRGTSARSDYKRPRVVGQGVCVAETGYTAINV